MDFSDFSDKNMLTYYDCRTNITMTDVVMTVVVTIVVVIRPLRKKAESGLNRG